MKIRSGFVSNSSSSSFVVKGYLLPKDNFDYSKMIEIMDKFEFDYGEDLDEDTIKDIFYWEFTDMLSCKNIYIGTNTEDGCPDDNTLMIGELLAEADDEGGYFDTMVLDLENSPSLEDLKEKLDINAPIKIIVGTRCC
jgi:hypothetical protein